MSLLPAYRPRRNCVALLLLALGLLASCRSGQVAFQFPPIHVGDTPLRTSTPKSENFSSQDLGSKKRQLDSTYVVHSPLSKSELLMRRKHTFFAARHFSSAVSMNFGASLAITKQGRKHVFRKLSLLPQTTSHSKLVHLKQELFNKSIFSPKYSGPSDEVVILFLVCLLGMLLSFLAALIFKSPTMAFVGLGFLLTLTFITLKINYVL